jgi:heat shock protein 4
LNESQLDEKYAHVTDGERQQCHAKCDEISSWIYDMLDKQGSLPQHVDPVLKVADINSKNAELTKVCNPVMLKPAPKKEVKVEKPAEQKDATNAKETPNGAAPEPMDATAEKAPDTGTEPVEMERD